MDTDVAPFIAQSLNSADFSCPASSASHGMCCFTMGSFMINCCKNTDIIEYNIAEMTNHISADVLNGGNAYLECRNEKLKRS